MADVKWIKITTDIFNDEKILLIENLPSADSIIVIWFKLLVLAGKQNNNGVFLMNDCIAYTDEMLAVIFRRDINIVRLALDTFERYGMIEIIKNVITIPKWNKYQSLDAYEKKKIRDREYQEKRRAEQKLQAAGKNRPINRLTSDDVSADVSDDSSSDVVVSDIYISSSSSYSTLPYYSENTKGTTCTVDTTKTLDTTDTVLPSEVSSNNNKLKHKYGHYNNVLLSDLDVEKLKSEFPTDWENRIEQLSEYIASKGVSYKNHLATIRSWARRENAAGFKMFTTAAAKNNVQATFAQLKAEMEGEAND